MTMFASSMSIAAAAAVALLTTNGVLNVDALRYDPQYADYNLNQNQAATNPLEYNGKWDKHVFTPSPENWRMPFYTLFLDRFVNGDPSNDNINGTHFEQDIMGTQLRFGGDITGLADTLDYIQGLGIGALYVAGSPFINQPWSADSYSPLDHTLLDMHFGNIDQWRAAINEIHRRGMYIILDNTVATMGDLIGFENYLNESAPFWTDEHHALWKSPRRYHDFDFGTDYNETCDFPRFYVEDGEEVDKSVYDMFKGCYNGEFDQFGDTEAFGVYPDYRRQITKFASVQDRLREWVPSVREKIAHFSCIAIQMLDIDGYRYDKATQVTVDAEAEFSAYIRECARGLNKTNFFLPGEITGGNRFGAIYVGRGRQPRQYLGEAETAVNLTNATNLDVFLRDEGQQALDSAAFHYSIYRNLLRFLGMDGSVEAAFDLPKDWVTAWNVMLQTNDFVNAETGLMDPRHMYGVVNQDVFRWPAIKLGVERNLLGLFITTLHMPGIPLLLWGEEQAFYVLDNTASNYMYGRQPIASSPAWQAHGCYALEATLYYDMPLDAARKGCEDDTVSWDHRDPSHPVRNIIKHMYHLREDYPVLKDGFYLKELSKQTEEVILPGSSGTPTEMGLWSIMRAPYYDLQHLGNDTTPIWLLYHNRNATTTYQFDCTSDNTTKTLLAPFDAGTTVKNLFFPHQEMKLDASVEKLHINGSTKFNGCSGNITLQPFEFRAYVPKKDFLPPPAMITKFTPGHDFRIVSSGPNNTLSISFQASAAMDCDAFTRSISFNSTTDNTNLVPRIDNSTVKCANISEPITSYVGSLASAWSWSADVVNLAPGIHRITVDKPKTADKGSSTGTIDKFLVRIGETNNPIVFPTAANYSSTLLTKNDNGDFTLNHSATGATKFRYSMNWESSWSEWLDYSPTTTIAAHLTSPGTVGNWSGTRTQQWDGDHVIVQYYSQLLGTSAFVQHGDANFAPDRRFPHMFAAGPYNEYGYDAGLKNKVKLTDASTWEFHYMDEWPAHFHLSIWGVNPDGKPDQSFVYGDIDSDGVLERLPPSSLVESTINISTAPARPYLAYRLIMHDATLHYELRPVGSSSAQLALYLLLCIFPVIGGLGAVYAFKRSFYKVNFNKVGFQDASPLAMLVRRAKHKFMGVTGALPLRTTSSKDLVSAAMNPDHRRKVLIATMEYNIDDWNIKIKIGGLGVMAQLMGKALKHQDLIWVVPCVGDIKYPIDTPAESMFVKIMDQHYEIKVQYHKLENITYVLLDAPVFRKQTKAVPYPPRMDDLESAIYYSAWNQCIAETINRFPVDLYHINDYHGAAALLYLLPRTVPAALSLHNAEFQGMWPMRTPEESLEVCKVYNLPQEVVKEYVQFGNVFNLLHAGASYLRIHQDGFGAVGVSKKYGERSFARYPIFWGLSKIGKLPNPDPTDTAEWDKDELMKNSKVKVDANFEAGRPELKRQAQEWAGLTQDPKAELFVFVGRWSLQKGVDLIADIFPSVLEQYPQTQLICIGPVIDLYGRFAALKLSKLMEKYPGRVFSKPEFTVLPPYIFSGAEFALIPSRDEPFGLVAVEFGRKGALGVGARVGGLGQMPGWWYTVESTKATHLLTQFKHAIAAALEASQDTRAMMRAFSAKQRFPVAQWLEKLEKLQGTAIDIHGRSLKKASKIALALPKQHHGNHSSEALNTEIELVDRMPAWMKQVPDHDDDNLSRPNTGFNTPNTPNTGGFGSPTMDSGSSTPNPFHLGHGRNDSEIFPGGSPLASAAYASHDRNNSSLSLTVNSLVRPPYAAHDRNDSTLSLSVPASGLTPRPIGLGMHNNSSRTSMLSLDEVVGERQDFKLQKVDPFFTDSTGEFYAAYEEKLSSLTAKNSAAELCIEDYLMKSEKEWFDMFSDAKLGRGRSSSPSPSSSNSRDNSRNRSRSASRLRAPMLAHNRKSSGLMNSTRVSFDNNDNNNFKEQFGIGEDYVPPTGLKKYLQLRVGDWPVYTMLLALNQIIASQSYQITLLTGEVGQTATKLYVIASIYLAFTIVWYMLSRTMKLLYPLSLPFFVYGLAFIVLGFSPFSATKAGRGWTQNVATGIYAAASSSGSISFAFNFGTDGGSTISKWIQRLALIQGLGQVYTIALWGWGSAISAANASSQPEPTLATSPALLAVCLPIAFGLWGVGVVLYLGLPDFYRESPGPVPQLWKTLLKRKTIAWYLLAVVLQNYFLSTLYGRNWFFMFGAKAMPIWGAVLLALGFFIITWCIVLFVLAKVSQSHPWLFPMFSVGLGAPRWAQMLWGTSRIGLYLPWAGGALASAVVSRLLWLWLGLLDGIQGAGIGMILMLTLTRIHVAAAVVAAQVIGSVATMVARASAPDQLGPADVFPDLSEGVGVALSKAWFWVVLLLQLFICLGYFKFFRKEQVSKP